MRKWVPVVLVAALVPVFSATLAAQEPPPKQEKPIPLAQARSAALARVTGELQANKIEAWNGKAPSGLSVVSASQGNLGGRAAYIVAVQMMKSTGIVRVLVDARTGAIIQSRAASWDWGNAPAWFKAGENSPPPARR